jgi:hypothetical protein
VAEAPVSYRHVVLFRMYDDTPRQVVDALMNDLRAVLQAAEGVEAAQVTRSLDERKGVVVVEDVTFASATAYETFRSSADHQRIAARMAQHADWLVGDYES